MVSNAPLPTGQRFSLTYLKRGAAVEDSERFRRRLSQLFERLVDNWQDRLAYGKILTEETGARLPTEGSAGSGATMLILQGELRDVLDLITVFYKVFKKELSEAQVILRYRDDARERARVKEWRDGVARILREENVGYRLDEDCGVHYFVDEEFEHSKIATLSTLQHPGLGNARASFDDVFRHLDSQPRDTKAAVRSAFEALEIIAKQIVPGAQNLNKRMLADVLRPVFLAQVSADPTEQKAWSGLFDSMGEWVNAVHNYRHGQAGDAAVAPSDELAVFLISAGCAYIRTLAECYIKQLSIKP